ncbi:MAG: UvrD-helicase domain-containing protein [Spirochaetaceae bacterium]|jgi:ATP-dependent helicase/nuclease subunit A|nr:UvrD-helicase domain-containing protein [Spirochaetaceae bacterium]
MGENIKTLRAEQKKAVEASCNLVVTAGAGSGKTSVLAARYLYLVIEKGLKVDEILTLTFTNKAANEMYQRIYSALSEQKDNERAARALSDFYKAKILTIDSFCAEIARSGAAFFGLSPDFKNDDELIKKTAGDAALSFVLNHRENRSLRTVIADRKIQLVSEELFAATIMKYSSLSSPLDFDSLLALQLELLVEAWKKEGAELYEIIANITSSLEYMIQKEDGPYSEKNERDSFQKLLSQKNYTAFKESWTSNAIYYCPDICRMMKNKENDSSDDILERKKFVDFINFLSQVCSIKAFTNLKIARELNAARRALSVLFDEKIYPIANIILRLDTIRDIFGLLTKFQDEFNQKKRLTGLLTFNDIARLAVDTLISYPSVREIYKAQIKAVMVDEFQDNNDLQRDLIFLIAEEESRLERGLPDKNDLSKSKMFFVGDEKQSIYRFRGADVAVFRSLSTMFPETPGFEHKLELNVNFRSKNTLIQVFNHLFSLVFQAIGEKTENYEAEFKILECGRTGLGGNKKDVRFCFLQKSEALEKNKDGIDEYDIEAAFIAEKIRQLVDDKYPVLKRQDNTDREVPCEYSDFAILLRKKTHIRKLESHLVRFGIPYHTEEPSALWKESVINDMLSYLRCIVYPDDKLSFAALLRSPFVRLNDNNFASCLVQWKHRAFEQRLEEYIEGEEEKARFKRAKEKYMQLRDQITSGKLSIAQSIAELWYGGAYRFETLCSSSAQKYAEIYDYFFEIGRRFDEQGKNFAMFIEELEEKKNGGGIKDNLEIPIEKKIGVNIMTIHKSKGLQFPIVFVSFCGEPARERNEYGIVYAKKLPSSLFLSLNLSQAQELNGTACKNYFYERFKNDDKKMAVAEIKRLLYVAATRAESALFFTAALPKISEEEKKNGQYEDMPDSLQKRLLLFRDKIIKKQEKNKNEDTVSSVNFLELLIHAITSPDDSLWEIEMIPERTGKEIESAAKNYNRGSGGSVPFSHMLKIAKKMYAEVRIEDKAAPLIEYKSPSALELPDFIAPVDAEQAERDQSKIPDGELPFAENNLDSFLKKTGLSPAEFGELTHNVIEDTLDGIEPLIKNKKRKRIRERAVSLAGTFFSSELGKKCMSADWRKSEYDFISLIEDGGNEEYSAYDHKKIFIQGRIDLFFKYKGTIYIVDFKTDKEIKSALYTAQMKAYTEAIHNLYPKEASIKTFLFFLRYGKAIAVE